MSPALPFPAFVMSYTINGIGMAVQDAQANGYTASMRDHPEARMGMLHAAYGMSVSIYIMLIGLSETQKQAQERFAHHLLLLSSLQCVDGLFIISVPLASPQ